MYFNTRYENKFSKLQYCVLYKLLLLYSLAVQQLMKGFPAFGDLNINVVLQESKLNIQYYFWLDSHWYLNESHATTLSVLQAPFSDWPVFKFLTFWLVAWKMEWKKRKFWNLVRVKFKFPPPFFFPFFPTKQSLLMKHLFSIFE